MFKSVCGRLRFIVICQTIHQNCNAQIENSPVEKLFDFLIYSLCCVISVRVDQKITHFSLKMRIMSSKYSFKDKIFSRQNNLIVQSCQCISYNYDGLINKLFHRLSFDNKKEDSYLIIICNYTQDNYTYLIKPYNYECS